jgi:hypothetical protein
MARRAPARIVRLALAAAVAALPLAARAMQQRGRGGGGGSDDETAGGGPAQVRFPGPTVPASARLEDELRERGDPALAVLSDGRIVLVAIEHQVGTGDRLAAWWLGPDGKPAAPAVAVTKTAAQIVRPVALATKDGRLAVAWTQLVGGVGQIHFTRGDEKGFEPPRALTSGATQHRQVATARDGGGTLWFAWEEWRASASAGPDAKARRGSFDVLLAPLEGDSLGASVAVGDGRGSDLDPSVACAGTDVWVAWSRWTGRDYEIALRRYDAAKRELAAPLNVSSDAPADDSHPSLAAGPKGELWLAWDRVEDGARGSSTPPDLRTGAVAKSVAPPRASVRVACVRVGEKGEKGESGAPHVTWPRIAGAAESDAASGLLPGVPFLSLGGGRPRVAVAPDGRVAIATRCLARRGAGGRAYSFPVLLHAIDGRGIGAPLSFEGSDGGLEEPALVGTTESTLVAWQQDHHAENEAGSLQRPAPQDHFQGLAPQHVRLVGSLAPSGLGVARIATAPIENAPASAADGALAPAAPRLAPDHFHPLADPAEPIASGDDHDRITVGATTWTVYWGDLHRHSSVSRCSRGFEPGPDGRWEQGRDVCLYDFMALTEHSGQVDARAWWRLDARGQLENTPDFCALAGFEWSTGLYGHENVILRGGLAPFLSDQWKETSTLPGLYAALDPATALAIPHHPADLTRRTNFARCDPKLVRLVELYQAQRGSYEFDGCFKQSHQAQVEGCFGQDAAALLDVGFIASSDHGEGASYACVLAEKLDREHLFDALRARRTYGATVKGMLVDFRVDDHAMGESFAASGPRRVRLKLRGVRELADVVVFRNGVPWRVVGRAEPAANASVERTLTFDAPNAKESLAGNAANAARLPFWVRVRAAACDFESAGEVPPFARAMLQGELPAWKVAPHEAVFTWAAGYDGYWEKALARVRLRGPADDSVTIEAGTGPADTAPAFTKTAALRDVAGKVARGDSPLGAWELDARDSFDGPLSSQRSAGDGALHSLGTRDFEQEWSDEEPPPGRAWYYARTVQVDGETAWSSPVYVTAK